jgi:hypothetical protein
MPFSEILYDHVWSEAWDIYPSLEALNIFPGRIWRKRQSKWSFSSWNWLFVFEIPCRSLLNSLTALSWFYFCSQFISSSWLQLIWRLLQHFFILHVVGLWMWIFTFAVMNHPSLLRISSIILIFFGFYHQFINNIGCHLRKLSLSDSVMPPFPSKAVNLSCKSVSDKCWSCELPPNSSIDTSGTDVLTVCRYHGIRVPSVPSQAISPEPS